MKHSTLLSGPVDKLVVIFFYKTVQESVCAILKCITERQSKTKISLFLRGTHNFSWLHIAMRSHKTNIMCSLNLMMLKRIL